MIAKDQPTIFDSKQLIAAVSSKEDGNVKYEQGDDAEGNILRFAKKLNITSDQLVVMYVNDPDKWDEIYEVTAQDMGRGSHHPETRIHADAFITNTPGAALMLPTADCNPVVIYDPERHAVALVHLGWQSTAADLAHKVVQKMQAVYGSKPEDLLVYIGPAIKKESYIFDDPAQAHDPAWKDFLHKTNKGFGIDLPGFNTKRLKDAGVLEANIQICPVDTAVDDNYFSHYRVERSGDKVWDGRFATVVAILDHGAL